MDFSFIVAIAKVTKKGREKKRKKKIHHDTRGDSSETSTYNCKKADTKIFLKWQLSVVLIPYLIISLLPAAATSPPHAAELLTVSLSNPLVLEPNHQS